MPDLTEQQAIAFLAAPKVASGPLIWVAKPVSAKGEWLEANCSNIEFVAVPGEILEGVKIVCQWRASEAPKSHVLTFGLIAFSSRVCAVDIQPDDEHKNKVGKGKSYYGRAIAGIHEHIWVDEGYGYAEPVAIAGIHEYMKAWDLFLQRAGIVFNGELDFPEGLIQADLF